MYHHSNMVLGSMAKTYFKEREKEREITFERKLSRKSLDTKKGMLLQRWSNSKGNIPWNCHFSGKGTAIWLWNKKRWRATVPLCVVCMKNPGLTDSMEAKMSLGCPPLWNVFTFNICVEGSKIADGFPWIGAFEPRAPRPQPQQIKDNKNTHDHNRLWPPLCLLIRTLSKVRVIVVLAHKSLLSRGSRYQDTGKANVTHASSRSFPFRENEILLGLIIPLRFELKESLGRARTMD